MVLLLLVLMLLAWIVCLRAGGVFSLWTALLLGFTAYTSPVLLGSYLRIGSGSLASAAVSLQATQVFLWAWLWLLVFLLIFLGRRVFSSPHFVPVPASPANAVGMYDSRSRTFCLLCIATSLALYGWISIVDSPLYFLDQRQTSDVSGEAQKLLWKWVNLFGLVAAILIRSRVAAALFLGFILMYFIAGDRTMVMISGVAVAVYFFSGERGIRRLLRWELIFLVALVAVMIMLGKPIYHAIKTQSSESLAMLIDPDNSTIVLSFFEPLLTHTILEDVLRTGFSYSWVEVGRSVIGQFLIVPSAFGIDSSAFNVTLQKTLYPHLGFGIANHYFAQAWSLGSWAGVAIFSFFLVLLTGIFSALSARASPLPRIMFLTMGVVVGTYFFRNSLENIFSMLRQIFLVGAFLLLATQILVPAAARRSPGSRQGAPATVPVASW